MPFSFQPPQQNPYFHCKNIFSLSINKAISVRKHTGFQQTSPLRESVFELCSTCKLYHHYTFALLSCQLFIASLQKNLYFIVNGDKSHSHYLEILTQLTKDCKPFDFQRNGYFISPIWLLNS